TYGQLDGDKARCRYFSKTLFINDLYESLSKGDFIEFSNKNVSRPVDKLFEEVPNPFQCLRKQR
ncbi:MAG TPA: hypothetical protein P5318_17445, partial [Candidatus Hydrogenedentes bacterium]|nr:hypothetical protein [Candidatus Hydrogenedentota bacterium]